MLLANSVVFIGIYLREHFLSKRVIYIFLNYYSEKKKEANEYCKYAAANSNIYFHIKE